MTNDMARTAETLGKLGLPMPVASMKAREWDVIVVGAGHNGLTCAAYLARAGRRVLVLESRERVGGACTLEEPRPKLRVSPCAYLLGLLHPRVIEDLELVKLGLRWTVADAGMFVPFEDGESVQLWDDAERCEAEVGRVSPGDVKGWRALGELKARVREAIRPEGDGDMWLEPYPKREEIERRLKGDEEGRNLLFRWSMAELLERFLEDERLQLAMMGQGVIGTNASPFEPGTASIHWHHQSGRLGGVPGAWGYVQGGMGMVSFLLADAAREAGAVIATGVGVGAIEPGRGVRLESGERIEAPVVVSNADPESTLRMLGESADAEWKARVEEVPRKGCTVKLNVALSELPNFRARPGRDEVHHRGQINIPLSKREWQRGFETARRGELPERLWCELYFQTVHDPSVAPEGVHSMSVFAQYVPHTFAEGSWETRREEVRRVVIESIGQFCSNLPEAVMEATVLGPPDIEARVGLAGGHIFQGECLPEWMWDRRLAYRTPMEGVYLCGAGTHPGGSVIAVNGRNAAMVVLEKETA